METDDILDVFDHGDRLTTPEVAAALEISQRAAWVYLSDLVDDGLLERQIGSGLQMDTWSLSDAGQETAGDAGDS